MTAGELAPSHPDASAHDHAGPDASAHGDVGPDASAHGDVGPDASAHGHDDAQSVLDCSAVLADVWLFLDHECDTASRARLQQHLDECGPCLTQFGIEEQVKSLLGRKCGGDKAPTGLRDRLSERLRASVFEVVDGALTSAQVDADGDRLQI